LLNQPLVHLAFKEINKRTFRPRKLK
jgi:hypothetical protein